MANPNRSELAGKVPLPGTVASKPYKPTTSAKANERNAERSKKLGVTGNSFGFASSSTAGSEAPGRCPSDSSGPQPKIPAPPLARDQGHKPATMNYSPWGRPPRPEPVKEPEIKRAKKR